MKEHVIEIVVDEKGNITAETKSMQGKICVAELDKVLYKALEGIPGEREEKKTGHDKPSSTKQTVTRG